MAEREIPLDHVEPGTFRVTMKIERPDGQFVTSVCEMPAVLADHYAMMVASIKVAEGFADAYVRCAELPA